MYRIVKIPVCPWCEHDLEVFKVDTDGEALSWICPHCGAIEYDPLEEFE